MQKKLEIVFWLSVTGQNQPAAVTSGKQHVDDLDVTEFFQDGLRCQTRSIRHSAILQCDLQTVRQKSDEDGHRYDLPFGDRSDGYPIRFSMSGTPLRSESAGRRVSR